MTSSSGEGTGDTIRVLVVDDDDGTRALACTILSHVGYTLTTAASLAQAKRALSSGDLDLVVTDMYMPDGTGIDLVREVKREAPLTEVIAMTGYGRIEDAVECLREGAQDYVVKPLESESFLRTVERALTQRKLRGDLELLRATQGIFSTEDPDRVPAVVVETAMAFLGADDASLMLTDDNGDLRLAHSHRLSGQESRAPAVEIGTRISGLVALDKRPALLGAGAPPDPRFEGVDLGQPIRSSIVYPLTVGDSLVGVLNLNRLDSTRAFSSRDVMRAGGLASQIAVALRNRLMVKDLRSRIEELKKAQSHLVQSERLVAIGQIAAGVAHEINNPVSYIMANIEYVLAYFNGLADIDDEDPAAHLCAWWKNLGGADGARDFAQALQESHGGGARIRQIVNDVQMLARDSGVSRFDLGDAVRSACRVAEASIRGRGELLVDIEPGAMVQGCPGEIAQALINLLVNAAHAGTGAQEGINEIRVTCRRDADRVKVTVSDTGGGIAPDDLPHVFEPFFTTKPPKQATGLGLPMSRDIVMRHGGTLELETKVGHGTTVTASFPATEPADEASQEPRLCLLFVDDEPAICKSYRRLFERQHRVHTVPDADQALQLLSDGTDFDVVFCDLVMPGTSGIELYRRACEISPSLGARFVFVTGGTGRTEVQDFIAGVGNPVLEKPVTMTSFEEAIAQISSPAQQV